MEAAIYIFKLRSGNDGSAKTLKTRHLLECNESIECETCWEEETPVHILEDCVRYWMPRQILKMFIKSNKGMSICC